MNFLSLCSGIGGFDWGVMLAGHNLTGYAECDTECKKCKTYTQHRAHESKEFYTVCCTCGHEKYQPTHRSFSILHDPERRLWNAYDIRSVSDDAIRRLGESTGGGIQLIVGGFPCQAFSIAGKREGFRDATRGTLIYEILRFASILRPRNLLLENVEGLLSHDGGKTFETILGALDELGYDAEWQVHNSSAYVPQNRERIFIIGHLRGVSARKVFPFGRESGCTIEVVGKLVGNHDQNSRVYGVNGISPTLSTMQGGGQEPKILDDQGRTSKRNRLSSIAPTLRAQTHGNEPKVVVAGQLDSDSGGTGKVYDPQGIAPTQLAQHGNAVTKIFDNKPTQFSFEGEGIAYCLDTGYAKNLSPNEVGKGKRTQIVTVGNVNPSGNGMNGQVIDPNGLSPTLTTNKGEGVKVLQRQFNGQYGVSDDVTGTLQASRVDKVPMVIEEPRAVLTPDRLEKRQNGRRMKEPGEPMFTLTAQDLHGVAVTEVESGLIHSRGFETRKDGISHCLKGAGGGSSGNFILEKSVYRIRKLTPLECFRLQSYPDEWYVILKLYRNPELIGQIDMSRNDITEQVLTIIQLSGIKEGMSDSQLYKMAGNGVTSFVAWDISRRMEDSDEICS